MAYNSDAEENEEEKINLGEYVGEKNENEERHGFGKTVLPNGDKYEGNYAFGKRHGEGTYIFVCGAKYKGNYVRGKKEGFGKFYNIDGSYYEGHWSKNEKNGNGIYVYPNGDKYSGDWLKNKRHGRGAYHYKLTGSIFDGRWVDGKYHGLGELIHVGHRYIGSYENGLPVGKGKYIFNRGYEQHGVYKRKVELSTTSEELNPNEEDKEVINVPVWKPTKILQIRTT